MDRMHKKSALAGTSSLLLAASDLGTPLAWDRYERQLPLCGFTSSGLNCRRCLQGPCRINPFGDEPSQGVCGADRDQIAMETLFQLTLEGVLETARAQALCGEGGGQEFPDIASGLPPETRQRLASAGLLPVRITDLFRVQNAFFSHKGYLGETLRDLVRLSLIQHGLLSQAAAAKQSGSAPAPEAQGLNILMVGQAPAGLACALEAAGQKAGGRAVSLFTQGSLACPAGRPAADQGSPELLLGMKVDAVLVAPNAAWPSLEALASKYGIPVVLAKRGTSPETLAAEVVDLAAHRAQNAFYGSAAQAVQAAPADRLPEAPALRAAALAGRVKGVVLLFGEAGVKQTFFERTLASMEAALSEQAVVLLGGELAASAEALGAELATRQGERLAAFAAALAGDGLRPVFPFGSAVGLPAAAALLSALPLPAAVAVPECYRASTWTGALGLVSLGFPVQIGARLPFWGSPWLAQTLPAELQTLTGGRLLAGPSQPEPRAQGEELAACLRAQGGRTPRSAA